MSKLERAKALLDAGALTPEEFEAEKARLMPGSASADGDPVVPVAYAPEEDEPNARPGWIKPVIAAVLLAAVAAIGYFLLSDRSTEPMVETAAPSPTAAPPATPTPTPIAAEFGCVGAYSDVSFSEEDGDGSGLFLRIGSSGSITWKYYEGGISRGIVKVVKRSADRIAATVRYPDYPSQAPSSIVLTCRDGKLSASGEGIGNVSLRRLTRKQAAELDL